MKNDGPVKQEMEATIKSDWDFLISKEQIKQYNEEFDKKYKKELEAIQKPFVAPTEVYGMFSSVWGPRPATKEDINEAQKKFEVDLQAKKDDLNAKRQEFLQKKLSEKHEEYFFTKARRERYVAESTTLTELIVNMTLLQQSVDAGVHAGARFLADQQITGKDAFALSTSENQYAPNPNIEHDKVRCAKDLAPNVTNYESLMKLWGKDVDLPHRIKGWEEGGLPISNHLQSRLNIINSYQQALAASVNPENTQLEYKVKMKEKERNKQLLKQFNEARPPLKRDPKDENNFVKVSVAPMSEAQRTKVLAEKDQEEVVERFLKFNLRK